MQYQSWFFLIKKEQSSIIVESKDERTCRLLLCVDGRDSFYVYLPGRRIAVDPDRVDHEKGSQVNNDRSSCGYLL